MAEQQGEKKHFVVPGKEELVASIKELDEDIGHISLNLIRCDFNATQNDVIKAFPDIKFLKVKNYKPGSFEVVLELRIDAINFIRKCSDRKILNRKFFIKLGRQSKELVQDWAFVGYVPRNFQNNNQHHRRDNKQKFQNKHNEKQGKKKDPQQKQQDKKPDQQDKWEKEAEKLLEEKTKEQEQEKVQPKQQEKEKDKTIPVQNKRAYGIEKRIYNQQKKKQEVEAPKQVQVQRPKTPEIISVPAVVAQNQNPNETKKKRKNKGEEKTQAVKQEQKKVETKQQDDGWIVVKSKTKKK